MIVISAPVESSAFERFLPVETGRPEADRFPLAKYLLRVSCQQRRQAKH